MKRSIREMEVADIGLVINYFLQSEPEFLTGMGVERSKLPSSDEWHKLFAENLAQPLEEREFYYIIWEIDDRPVGHSCINKIVYGEEAYVHLQLWESATRGSGNGTYLMEQSIACYFEKFHLPILFCEAYALNPAPNKTLPKVGFEFVKRYETTPGWITFHQPVNRWVLSREKWLGRL